MKHLTTIKTVLTFFLLSIFISSCGLLGIHFKVHNPKKAGSYPKETKKLLLLAADSKYRSCFDVYHYDLNVEIVPAKKFLSGKVIINAKAVNDFDTLQIDLYKNMKVLSIESNKTALTYKREEGAIFIKMPATIKSGESFSITVAYEGKPVEAKRPPWDGGFVWKKDKYKNPWIGVACETEGSSLWWPGKDMVNDEADSTDVSITVPKKLMAVSNGVLKDSIIGTEKNTYQWHISYPINNYNVTIYVGNFRLLQDTYASSITSLNTELNHYVLPVNYEKAKAHFQQVKKHLAFYEKTFGPYPWQRDGFKLVEAPYAGMEHQTAIAYGNGYKDDSRNMFDYIILHETAHEWWGNSVTAADLADGWLHEGFATYAEALYVESVSGRDAYTEYMYWQRVSIMNKRPVVRKRGIRYFDYHDGDIYNKGSWLLHTLRNIIKDDPLFFDILKTFRMENHGKQILSEAFIDLVNKKTGKDYNWFFKQYLFKREAPFFEYYWTNNELYFRWVNTDDDFVMPVTLKVNGKTITIHPKTKIQKIELNERDKDIYPDTYNLYYGKKENKKLKKEFSRNQ